MPNAPDLSSQETDLPRNSSVGEDKPKGEKELDKELRAGSMSIFAIEQSLGGRNKK